jgi:hypothetical protein
VRCDHEHDDGAYVLGALSPAERTAYERHLSTCSFCREAVAEIAVLPGLLGRLDPADFAKLLDPTLTERPPSARRTKDLVSAAQRRRRKERRRSRVRMFGSSLIAAVVALVVGVGVMFLVDTGQPEPLPGPTVAMTPSSADIPITAMLTLTASSGGTKVNLLCTYNKTYKSKPYTIMLIAHGPHGETDSMGSWVATPGKEFPMSGVTRLVGANLSRLELVEDDGHELLSYNVP